MAVLVLFLSPSLGRADKITGRASVVDGDTIEIHVTRIRLWGSDAPEAPSSAVAMTARSISAARGQRTLWTHSLHPAPSNLDQYGRTVATCSVRGVDLGEWLVSNGLALDWPQYSKGMYRQAQGAAEQAERGIWAGSFTAPWTFRACIKVHGTPARCSDGLD